MASIWKRLLEKPMRRSSRSPVRGYGHAHSSGGILEEPLFPPRSKRPMHIAVLGSGAGTILRAMLHAQKRLERTTENPLLFSRSSFFYGPGMQFPKNCRRGTDPSSLPSLRYKQFSREEYDQKGLGALLRKFEEKSPMISSCSQATCALCRKFGSRRFPIEF